MCSQHLNHGNGAVFHPGFALAAAFWLIFDFMPQTDVEQL